MPTGTETQITQTGGLIARVRAPRTMAAEAFILLHGWQGDENVMWVFAHGIPDHAWVIAPRGLHSAPEHGFGWTLSRAGINAEIAAYLPAVNEVARWYGAWAAGAGAATLPLTLVGFSQGAALAYSLGLTGRLQMGRIAGLAGFIPHNAVDYTNSKPMLGIPAFIAHGTRDETVPVERAREAVRLLEAAGARVNYCESDVGHKLGANCLRSLNVFMDSTPAQQRD